MHGGKGNENKNMVIKQNLFQLNSQHEHGHWSRGEALRTGVVLIEQSLF